VCAAAGGVDAIRPGSPQADARHSPLAFRILTPPTARASDHFGALQGSGIDRDRVYSALDALVDGGYLRGVERVISGSGVVYTAIAMAQEGRDALAAGVALPEQDKAGAIA